MKLAPRRSATSRPWRSSGSACASHCVYSGLTACTTTDASAAREASASVASRSSSTARAPAGSGVTGARRTCASTRQPAAAKAWTAAAPKRPLAPRIRTVRGFIGGSVAVSMASVSAGASHSTMAGSRMRAIHLRMAASTFDWALVRSFLAVLDAGSLMGAARMLGALQPTLSRHVAELEAQLGTPLFERTGRGVVPTAAALAIADAARRMDEGADALARALAARAQATTGTVRITTSHVAAVYLLPPVLAALREAEPGIQVELVASNQLTNLLRREADIAVRMVRPAQQSLLAKKVGDIGIGAYAHASY